MVVGLTPLTPVYSQNTILGPQQHQGNQDIDTSMTISQQLVELRGNIARLEAALEQDHRGSVPLANTQMGMGPMGCGEGGCGSPGLGMNTGKMSGMEQGGMGPMGKMGMGSQKMGMGSGSGMPGMGMENMGMMGKMGMGSQKMGMGSGQGMPRMEMENMGMMGKMGTRKGRMSGSALPGFPGASHLYHIGATDFFLDHGEHITLTLQQESALNQIKEQALLSQATFDRQLEQAEQELWVLTSSDQPEMQRIEPKVQHIEKLKGDQRLAFIRAVGEAAQVLTAQQRQVLIGTGSPQPKAQGAEQK
ncbi:hypothetical protein [Candidatus Nitronereus thalassa]|uniref:Periplasmic heavy metal sensor n=1 Tax=Candidatus Nitronereus thalassa TaxID=3020898 RepID=A0ABU3K2Y8_9BACT|nr:hypothetical protein [Candidatus Nitronereus thalassa]MDT7040734.1 hypothetical protein [Candidatus Nitronereus thalassa]